MLSSPPVFFASSLPLQVKVRHGEKECFLERLAAGCVRFKGAADATVVLVLAR
jgi:hypothetical protein